MEEGKLSPEALALVYLRSLRGWSQKRLSTELGFADVKMVSRYERGERTLTRELLEFLAAPLGYPPEAVDALLYVYRRIAPDAAAEPWSPVALTSRERQRIDRAALTAAWTLDEELYRQLCLRKRTQKTAAARQEAQELWLCIKRATRDERRDLVATLPEFRSWALAERLSHESVRAAAHRAGEALDLADFAVCVAERSPGEESWRSRLMGYCWAYVANARRVANDFAGAEEAFTRAWQLWRAGEDSDTTLLAAWRLLDLEASLRRAQHRFPEALELLEQALASCGGGPAAGRILLKKEHVFEQMGDVQGALGVLAQAAPVVESSGDLRLLFALRFKQANHLCHLERYSEAAERLPRVRELALDQGDELNLIRLVWLQARVAAGQGRREEAIAGLEQVRQDFAARQLPYDAALSSLELAALYLEEGRAAQVRVLALAMAWIFKARGIDREALAALFLFRDAAQQEVATAELARQVIAKVEAARRSASQREGRPKCRS